MITVFRHSGVGADLGRGQGGVKTIRAYFMVYSWKGGLRYTDFNMGRGTGEGLIPFDHLANTNYPIGDD